MRAYLCRDTPSGGVVVQARGHEGRRVRVHSYAAATPVADVGRFTKVREHTGRGLMLLQGRRGPFVHFGGAQTVQVG